MISRNPALSKEFCSKYFSGEMYPESVTLYWKNFTLDIGDGRPLTNQFTVEECCIAVPSFAIS